MQKIKILELFAGVGSQTQALKNLGIEHTSDICEFDKYASKSYELLHGKTFNYGDITQMNLKNVRYDLWTYSFPCQDLSIAGNRAGIKEGTRSGLLFEVERLLMECPWWLKPKYLLMENVKNLVGKKNKPDFDRWVKKLEELGYATTWKILNAKEQGVAQNRERVFAISSLDHSFIREFEWPEKIDLKYALKDYLQKDINHSKLKEEYKNTVNYIITPRKTDGKMIGGAYNRHWKDDKIIGTLGVKHRPTIVEKQKEKYYTPDNFKHYFLLKEKITKEDTLYQWRRRYVRENKSNLCPTLTANMGTGGHNVPLKKDSYGIRKLTPRECWRLMGYNDKQFDKVEGKLSNSQLYKQAGNGIVVPVLEQIFAKMFNVDYKDNHHERIDMGK